MNKIKFSYVWDKLNDPEFTTIRSWNKEKEDYYRGCIGQEFQVWESKETYPFRPEYVICHAWLYDVFSICPQELQQEMLEKDTKLGGEIQRDWLGRILKYEKVLLLIFSKNEPSQSKLEDMEVMEVLK